MALAIFPGSFDPVTKGHMDLIERSAALFDELVVAILVNPGKVPLFSLEERETMLRELTNSLHNVRVDSFQGLLADYVKSMQADVIVRGLRSSGDFEYELPLAQANRRIYHKAETIFLPTAPEHSFISSSGVKEVFAFGGDVRSMVPDYVYDKMQEKR